jgi:hypothetical protein
MKNLVISILAMQIITGLPFWQFDGNDRIYVGIAMCVVLFVNISVIEEWWSGVRRRAWMKKHRAERFGREVNEMKERKNA